MHKYYVFYNYYTEKQEFTRNTKEGMFNFTTKITPENGEEVVKKAELHLKQLLEDDLEEKLSKVKIIQATLYKEPTILATLEC